MSLSLEFQFPPLRYTLSLSLLPVVVVIVVVVIAVTFGRNSCCRWPQAMSLCSQSHILCSYSCPASGSLSLYIHIYISHCTGDAPNVDPNNQVVAVVVAFAVRLINGPSVIQTQLNSFVVGCL